MNDIKMRDAIESIISLVSGDIRAIEASTKTKGVSLSPSDYRKLKDYSRILLDFMKELRELAKQEDLSGMSESELLELVSKTDQIREIK